MIMVGAATLSHFIMPDIALLAFRAPHHEANLLITVNPGPRQDTLVVSIHVSNLNVGLHGISLPFFVIRESNF